MQLSPGTAIQSGTITISGTSQIVFTANPRPTAPAVLVKGNSCSLTLILRSGDPCYCNVNPDATDAVAGEYTDQIVLDSDNPSFAFAVFNPVKLQAISDGTSELYWIVGYRR